MILFIMGIFLGVFAGILVMCLCHISGQDTESND